MFFSPADESMEEEDEHAEEEQDILSHTERLQKSTESLLKRITNLSPVKSVAAKTITKKKEPKKLDIDPSALQMLKEMGFPEERCKKALLLNRLGLIFFFKNAREFLFLLF